MALILLSPALLLATPTAPTSITLTALSAHSVEISWTTNKENNRGYKIFRDGQLIQRISESTTKTFQDVGLSPNTTYNYTVKATDDETPETIENIVQRHNIYRNLEFTDSNLSWDGDLANHAKTWADYLATHYTQADADAGEIPHASKFQTDLHNEDDYVEGENIAWAIGNGARMPYYTASPVDISDPQVADDFPFGATDAWASEKAYYDYANNTQKAGYESKAIGHYTQLAWQKSTKIGCGRAISATDYPAEWVVCRYTVPGNYNGNKPYCSNYTVSDLYSVGNLAFNTAIIDNKSFAITKVLEDRDACTRTDTADSTLTFTGSTTAFIPQYNTFNTADGSNLWDMNFDQIAIDSEGILHLSNTNNDRYMTLKLVGILDDGSYGVEAYWWVINDDYYRRALLKLVEN